MEQYTWTIISTDSVTNTMQVQYSYNGLDTVLNVSLPAPGADFDEHIKLYAPVQQWRALATSTASLYAPGATGTHEFDLAPPPSEPATVNGNWDEEYLRALIYQVIEEINASQV